MEHWLIWDIARNSESMLYILWPLTVHHHFEASTVNGQLAIHALLRTVSKHMHQLFGADYHTLSERVYTC